MADACYAVQLQRKQHFANDTESEANRILTLSLSFTSILPPDPKLQPSLIRNNDMLSPFRLTGFLLNSRMLNELCATLLTAPLLGCHLLSLCLGCPQLQPCDLIESTGSEYCHPHYLSTSSPRLSSDPICQDIAVPRSSKSSEINSATFRVLALGGWLCRELVLLFQTLPGALLKKQSYLPASS